MQILKRFSFTPLSIILTVTVFLILCKLGFWQLERAKQKQELLAQQSAERVSQTEFLARLNTGKLASLNFQTTQLDLELKTDFVWLVDNKIFNGQVGYDVVVPAQVKLSETIILVNLGWWPAPQQRSELPSIELPNEIEINGLLKTTDLQQFTLSDVIEGDTFPKRVQSVNVIIDFKYSSGMTVKPVFLYADTNSVAGHPQLYKPVVMPPEKHIAYAVQWFLLAFASLVVFVYASVRSTNIVKEKEHQ